MPDHDGGDFYYDLVAQGYDHYLSGVDFGDLDFYQELIHKDGRPALELACGTGRLLLPLAEAGLTVHGLDSSDEMLAICRRKGEERGLSLTLHHQAMQHLGLAQRYGVVFCSVGSFSLLIDDADVSRTLIACREHFLPSGQLVLAIKDFYRAEDFDDDSRGEWCLRREEVDSEGRSWRAFERMVSEPGAPIVISEWRYELVRGGEVIGEQHHDSRLRCWTAGELASRMGDAGFRDVKLYQSYTDDLAELSACDFVAVGRAD